MKPNDEAYQAAILAIKENGPYYAGSKIRESMAKHLAEVALPAAYAAQFKSQDYAELVKWLRDKAESLSEIYPPEAEAADALEAVLAEREAYRERFKYFGDEFRREYDRICSERDAQKEYNEVLTCKKLGEQARSDERYWEARWRDEAKESSRWQRKQEETAKILGLAIDAILNRPTPVDGLRSLTSDEQVILSEVIRRAKEEKERDALLARLAPVEDEALVEIAVNEMRKQLPASGVMYIHIANAARAAIAAIRPHIEAAERERCIKAAKGRYEKLVPANEAAKHFQLGRISAAYEIEGKNKPSKTPPDTNTAQIDVREFVEKLDAPQQ